MQYIILYNLSCHERVDELGAKKVLGGFERIVGYWMIPRKLGENYEKCWEEEV